MIERLKLTVLPEVVSVCRLASGADVPEWGRQGGFWSVTKTGDELSVVCESRSVPAGEKAEHGFRALKILGPLDFALTGIVASLTAPLGEAGISVFVISTFDTDYTLVRETNLEKAKQVLRSVCDI